MKVKKTMPPSFSVFKIFKGFFSTFVVACGLQFAICFRSHMASLSAKPPPQKKFRLRRIDTNFHMPNNAIFDPPPSKCPKDVARAKETDPSIVFHNPALFLL